MGEGVEEMAKRSKDEDSLPTAKRQKKWWSCSSSVVLGIGYWITLLS
jgi:hypothetical protein